MNCILFKKLHPAATTPTRACDDDAGFDLTITEIELFSRTIGSDVWLFKTGIAVAIPKGFEGQLRARSSNRKNRLLVCNGVGTIDAGYRGELIFSYKEVGWGEMPKVGDKAGQIVFCKLPPVYMQEIKNNLPESHRGDRGHGSSDQGVDPKPADMAPEYWERLKEILHNYEEDWIVEQLKSDLHITEND